MEEKLNLERLQIERFVEQIEKFGQAVVELFKSGEIEEAVSFELQWPLRVI